MPSGRCATEAKHASAITILLWCYVAYKLCQQFDWFCAPHICMCVCAYLLANWTECIPTVLSCRISGKCVVAKQWEHMDRCPNLYWSNSNLPRWQYTYFASLWRYHNGITRNHIRHTALWFCANKVHPIRRPVSNANCVQTAWLHFISFAV